MLDAIVIGGGFYGAAVAVYLARRRRLRRIVLLEREPELLSRASWANQARVHNGYHYPRSYTTAFRSRVNLPRFVVDHGDAIRRDFTKLYAIARRNSQVGARQFERFCREIGAPLEPAPPALRALFDRALIESVYVAQEYAFDARVLATQARRELQDCAVAVRTSTTARAIATAGGALEVAVEAGGLRERLRARLVFNCTYSALNQFGHAAAGAFALKHELVEMALVRVPAPLAEVGVTLMDGPFFSLMPFPARGLHTLSHVRYTPHLQWIDRPGDEAPHARLRDHPRASRFERMRRDAARYLPVLAELRQEDSLFEVKTVLVRNEGDDGRPILFHRDPRTGVYSILGGKIDNIYDVLERLDAEALGDDGRMHAH